MSKSLSLLVLLFVASGCAIYENYGHGKVARSGVDQPLVTKLTLPPDAPSISQRFRPVDPPEESGHMGFDILVPHRTPVIAASDGVVRRVKLSLLYGKQIMIDHARGDAGFRLQTRYFHLTEQRVVEGEAVQRGQLVGYSGATGMAGVFPHLHFEVYRLSDAEPPLALKYLDPQLWWVDGVGQVTCFDNSREYAPAPVRLTYPVPCRGIAWR